MINPPPSFKDETLPERLLNHQDKQPECDSLRDVTTILVFQDTHSKDSKFVYIDPGCGKIYLCHDCAEKYNLKKYFKSLFLVKTLLSINPNIEFAHIVLTIPHEHPWCVEEGSRTYNKMFKAAEKTIEAIFPQCASFIALHNWSSKNPTEQHLHLHCFVFCTDTTLKARTGFVDIEFLREIWSVHIDWDEPIVVYTEYFKLRHLSKIKHVLKYNLRSPIQDWCSDHQQPLTADYLHRIKFLHRVHRIRWCGWLSNGKRKENLTNLGISEEKLEHNPRYKFICQTYSTLGWVDDALLLVDDSVIYQSDLLDFTHLYSSMGYDTYDDP